MQIAQTPPLPPAPASATQPQVVTNSLPHVLMQAVQPISQNAVAPTPKSERGERTRRRDDRAERDPQRSDDENRGGHVNISV